MVKMLLRFYHAYHYNLAFRLRPLVHSLVNCAVETETRVLRPLLKNCLVMNYILQ